MKACVLSIAVMAITCLIVLPANAGFVIAVDPAADLKIKQPGTFEVPILIKNDGGLLSSFNGLQIKIVDSDGARVRQVDVSDSSPFSIANINANNELAFTDIFTNRPFSTDFSQLVTLTFDISEVRNHTINLQFVEATRAGATILDPQITLAPSDFSIQSSFTLAAIPEPTSAALLAVVSILGVTSRRRRRIGHCI